MHPLTILRHHVTGAIERGEGVAIVEKRLYCYREGDGNDGNYPRYLIEIAGNQCPYAALVALAANRYIPGTRTRAHISKHMETDGEPAYGISGTVYEGPKGETAFDAAWLTAELEPATRADYPGLNYFDSLRAALDRGARQIYNNRTKGGKL